MIHVVDGSGDSTEFNELVKYHVMIASQLPELLAELAGAGREKEAIKLLIQWGTHTKANSEVWQGAKSLLEGKTA